LLQQGQSYNELLLCYPEPILTQRHEPRPGKDWCRIFYNRLVKMDVYLSAVTHGQLNTCQKQLVLPVIERLQSVLTGMRGHLMR
jgi:hypothetical protein